MEAWPVSRPPELVLVLRTIFRRAPEINIRKNRLRLEGHTVVIGTGLHRLPLLNKIRNVVRQAKEVLLVKIVAHLANNFQLLAVLFNRARPFNSQKVLVSDAVEKYNPALNLKIVC